LPQRLLLARQLIREKGLSKEDLALLEDMLRLEPLVEAAPERVPPPEESPAQAALRRNLGTFLAFLHTFSPDRLGEARSAMGLVLLHSLERLGEQAEAAHRELLAEQQQPDWVTQLLDLLASLRAMSLAPSEPDGSLRSLWSAFLADHREPFRKILAGLQESAPGAASMVRLNAQVKAVNRAIQGQGRLEESLGRLAEQLEACIPPDIHALVEPLLLLEHVVSNLRLSLVRPLDRGIHWPAVEQVRGSLRWLWNHLGWSLPRLDAGLFQENLPPDLRGLLQQLRRNDHPTFSVVARALTSHIALLDLLEPLEPAANTGLRERYAAVPTFLVLEAELGRQAERTYDPARGERLDPTRPEVLRLRAFLRQAAPSLRRDQETLRSLLQQALAGQDADQLAQTLDNLRGLLLNHQKQLMGELVGIFSAEMQQRLFPGTSSPKEEGDQLRMRVQRLWEQVPPLFGQLQLHLEMQDWPRLALGLAHAYRHLLAFRRSPEFPLLRPPDREEIEGPIRGLGQLLEAPQELPQALRDGMDLLGEVVRFLELFLLRINARVPLIRQDLEVAQEALKLIASLQEDPSGTDRTRLAHRLIQTAKRLGARDPQSLTLLRRWIRAERGPGEGAPPTLGQLAAHLRQLALRLEAAIG
jgi:hypothetical protein